MATQPGIGTARLSPTGELLDLDAAAAAIAGFASPEDARAAPDVPLFREAREWLRSREASGPAAFEQRWRAADGGERCAHVVVVPGFDGAGALDRFDAVVEDVCARTDAERAHLFLEGILDALPNPVFVKDDQHRFVFLNEAACRIIGRSRSELLGKSDYDFFPAPEADEFWRKDDVVFRTGEVNENEEPITDASGRTHFILTRKSLRTGADGRRYLLGVITDITERKGMEEALRRSRDELDARVHARTAELRRANEQLQEEDRRKNAFLGVLSHELRNPLEPMVNALYILDRADPGGSRAAEARAVVGRQLDHLTRLVDDLLDVTRISHGKIQLKRARIDLCEIVRRTAADHRAIFSTRGLALHVDVPPQPLVVDGDATRVAQIAGNLLQNAAKFTGAGGNVRVSLRAGDGRAILRVEDDGVGIAPSVLPRLFEPFSQADETLHRSSGGLGLGLALVKGLAELHGGSVEARSEGSERGAAFTVALPLAGGAAQERASLPPAAAPRRRRVLVVEDNLDAAETLRAVLEMCGHDVTVAYDGREGLAATRSLRPDLVLCDIGLPELDGYAVARAIRADPALAGTDLIALTGYALAEDQRRAMEAGFDGHLAKPARLDRIEALLARPPRRG